MEGGEWVGEGRGRRGHVCVGGEGGGYSVLLVVSLSCICGKVDNVVVNCECVVFVYLLIVRKVDNVAVNVASVWSSCTF